MKSIFGTFKVRVLGMKRDDEKCFVYEEEVFTAKKERDYVLMNIGTKFKHVTSILSIEFVEDK